MEKETIQKRLSDIFLFKNSIFNSIFSGIILLTSYIMLLIYGYKDREDFCIFPDYISDYADELDYGYFSIIGNQVAAIYFTITLQQYFNGMMQTGIYNKHYSLFVYVIGTLIIIFNLETLLFPSEVFLGIHSSLAVAFFAITFVFTICLMSNSVIYYIKTKKEYYLINNEKKNNRITLIDKINFAFRVFICISCTFSFLSQITPKIISSIYDLNSVDCVTQNWPFNLYYYTTTTEWIFIFIGSFVFITMGIEFIEMKKKGIDVNASDRNLDMWSKLVLFRYKLALPVAIIFFRVIGYITIAIMAIKTENITSIGQLPPVRYLMLNRRIASFLYAFIYISSLLYVPIVIKLYKYCLSFAHSIMPETKVSKFTILLNVEFAIGAILGILNMSSYLFQINYHPNMQIASELLYFTAAIIFVLGRLAYLISFGPNLKKKYNSILKILELINIFFLLISYIIFFITRIYVFTENYKTNDIDGNSVALWLNSGANWIFELLLTIHFFFYLLFFVKAKKEFKNIILIN